jgi:hypothetical protein
MSLIADALKKAEISPEDRPQAEQPSPEPSPRPDGLTRGLLILCVGLVLVGIAQVTRRPAARTAPAAAIAKPSAAALPESSKKPGIQLFQTAQAGLALSGTLLDNNGESLALINNQVLKEGDQIRGMRVVKVNTDSVELQDQDGKRKRWGWRTKSQL